MFKTHPSYTQLEICPDSSLSEGFWIAHRMWSPAITCEHRRVYHRLQHCPLCCCTGTFWPTGGLAPSLPRAKWSSEIATGQGLLPGSHSSIADVLWEAEILDCTDTSCTIVFTQRNGGQIHNTNLAKDEKGPSQFNTHMNTFMWGGKS